MFPETNEKYFDFEFMYLVFEASSFMKVVITAEFPNEEDRGRRKREDKEGNNAQMIK